MVNNYCSASCRDDTGGLFFIMFGVSNSREPIKGEFAKKLVEEVVKIRKQRMKKDYISNEKFDEKVDKTFNNITFNILEKEL